MTRLLFGLLAAHLLTVEGGTPSRPSHGRRSSDGGGRSSSSRWACLHLLGGSDTAESLYEPLHLGMEGVWKLDSKRSDSLAPFLESIGTPGWVAWLVGNQAATFDLIMAHHARGMLPPLPPSFACCNLTVLHGDAICFADNATEVTIRIRGREEESFSTRGGQDIDTPRGMVCVRVCVCACVLHVLVKQYAHRECSRHAVVVILDHWPAGACISDPRRRRSRRERGSGWRSSFEVVYHHQGGASGGGDDDGGARAAHGWLATLHVHPP